MPEVAVTGKDHRHSRRIGGGDHFLITHRSTRLDASGSARVVTATHRSRKNSSGFPGL
jgi:hypothetical protein